MDPSHEVKPERNMKVNVRTVADVEVGAVPTSPPATQQDREDFQKLLLQMNGVSLAPKGTLSDPSGKHSTNDAHVKHDKESENASALSDNPAKQKKKRKKSAKKSNKPSPSDSPLKSANIKESEFLRHDPQPGKTEVLVQAASQSSQAENVPSTSAATVKTPCDSQPKPQSANKAAKPVREARVVKKVIQRTTDQGEPSNAVTQGNFQPMIQKKDKDTVVKHILKDLKKANVNANTNLMEMRSEPGKDCQDNGDFVMADPFEKQPYLLLKAAVNLIKPKKKISAVKEINSFHCIPCDKIFSDIDRHLEKTKDSHVFNWKCEMRERTVDLLPSLTQKHIDLLETLVLSTVEKNKVPEEHDETAHTLWENLHSLAKSTFGCSVRWFGSHASGIALSDNKTLNMDLQVPNKEDAATTFLNFITAVEKNFKDVERVVATNFAHANIFHKGLLVQLSLNNNGAYHTSKLISDYISIDKRVLPMCIFFRYWGKMCCVDQGENGSWQGHAFPIMVIHFLQQRLVLPVLHDLIENPDGNPEIYLDPKSLPGRWFVRNKDSVGKLIYEMFRYYAFEHDVERHVVSITQFKPYLRQDTKWNAKRIAVIDPFQPKHNISRYISASMYDYVHFCLLTTTCALGIPRSEEGPLFGYIGPRPERSIFEQTPAVLEEYMSVSENIFELILRLDSNFVSRGEAGEEEKFLSLKAQLLESPIYHELVKVLKVVPPCAEPSQPAKSAYSCWWVTPYQAKCLAERFNQDAMKLVFCKELCTDKELPPVTCTSCHKSGHLRAKCPDEVIPKMNPVPPPTKELSDLLNRLCLEIFETRCSEDSGLEYRLKIRNELLHHLKQFYPDIDLHLFGSSLNGFGGRSSDIDMCLTFHSNATGEGLNFPALVEEIQHRLKGLREIYQLVAITTAKVPIVKFAYGRSGTQVDISLYNRLGIMNTKLLHAYSTIDPRVRPLVYMMKSLAKTTGIGDASRGSLSSYAYSLMSLFFLQQVEPPVIPVLQELYEPNIGPKVETVDGANVYFFRNPEKLDEVWPHRNKNKSSLGELWLQLLEFYASERFHNSQRVVCIRKKIPLYKFDKLWTSTNICIEDPFDLNHNLGSGLSKRMNIFIVKTFQRACKHFSSLPKPDRVLSLEKWYFNENSLSVGKPPSDRGCHFCRSIGHVQNDCPQRLRLQQRLQQGAGVGPGMGQGRPNPRGNRAANGPGQQGPRRPNSNQPFESPFMRGMQGNRRDNMPRNREFRDPGRISNMPMPMAMPMAMPNAQGMVQNAGKSMNQGNLPKAMNMQNHLVVGSMKPPGFPAVPPGYAMGAPMRMMAPQMVAQMTPQMSSQMAPQMQPPMSSQIIQGSNPPFMMNRPVRFQW